MLNSMMFPFNYIEKIKNKNFFLFLDIIRISSVEDQLKNIKYCDVLMFCHDNDLGLNIKNKAYSPLMDSVREDIERRGWRCQTISHPFSKIKGDSAWSNPILMNRSYLIAKLEDKLFQSNLLKFIFKKKQANTIDLYRDILKKSKPNCIIAIGSPPELCRAAREQKILCVELLHGIGFYRIEWGFDKRSSQNLPEVILSFDNRSTKTFQSLKHVTTRQIPHPFIKRFKSDIHKKYLPVEWKNNEFIEKNKRKILISLQWGYDGSCKQFKGIIKNHIIIDELIKVVESTRHESIIWAFRLHPAQLRSEKYINHLNFIDNFCKIHKNTQWKWFTEMPLPVVLKQCAGHITMSSVTSYEAAYMGIKTLALCPTLQKGGYYQDMFSDLEETGYLTKIQADVGRIVEWAENVQPIQPFLDNLCDEEAWENVLEWMLGSRYKDKKETA